MFDNEIWYQVRFAVENDKIIGYLNGKGFQEGIITFNPLHILSDLSSNEHLKDCNWNLNLLQVLSNYFKEENLKEREEIDMATMPIEKIWEVADDSFEYGVEYGFGIPIQVPDDERDLYTRCVKDIRKIMQLGRTINIQELELFKTYLEIKTTLSISASQRFPLSKFLTNAPDIRTVPVGYGYYSLEQLFDLSLSANLEYIYDCFTLRDVVFAILHYLMIHNYKFVKCIHCGRYFATKSKKQFYCTRTSPYIYDDKRVFSPNPCAEAVKQIRDTLIVRRKKLYRAYYARYNGDSDKFLQKYPPYEEYIKIKPSVENFKNYERFLFVDNKLRNEKSASL